MKIIKEKQIKEICKKHPKWKELFISYLNDNENLSIDQLKETFNVILNYKHIFKELIHEAKELMNINDNRSILERLNDKVTLEIHNHQKNQFIHSLKTEKYQHLFNEKIEKEIHTILDNKISIKILKHQFFNKLSRYKGSGELLLDLKEFKNKNIQWNKEYYLNLIKENNLNVEILEDQNGYMNIQVNDYEACKALGSQAWCIVQNQNHFNQYIDNTNRQIISLNFDLPIENNESMIGFTIQINGKINDSYLKNDDPTSQKTKEIFHFKSLPNEKIKDILSLKNHQDAFDLICEFGLIDFYDEYIENYKIIPNLNKNNAIIVASSNGNVDVVNRLLEDPRVDPSDNNNWAIRLASFYGHFEIVNRLLEDPRVDPSDDNNCSIKYASFKGHLNVVNCLLDDPRVDPSTDNNYAICWASYNGHLNIVNRLLEDPRVDPSDNNNYAIRYAYFNEHLQIINRLLEDKRVCQTLDKQWVKENLSDKELEIFEKNVKKRKKFFIF